MSLKVECSSSFSLCMIYELDCFISLALSSADSLRCSMSRTLTSDFFTLAMSIETPEKQSDD
jgi:hypothetical protein